MHRLVHDFFEFLRDYMCWREIKNPLKSLIISGFVDVYNNFCGETGIRTQGTLLAYTHFPGVLLRPLGHLSGISEKRMEKNEKGQQ